MSSKQEWEEWYYKNIILPEQFPDSCVSNDSTIYLGSAVNKTEYQPTWIKDQMGNYYLLSNSIKLQGENQWVSFKY